MPVGDLVQHGMLQVAAYQRRPGFDLDGVGPAEATHSTLRQQRRALDLVRQWCGPCGAQEIFQSLREGTDATKAWQAIIHANPT